MKGNIVMKGYFKNPEETEKAFAGGWFHSGDLGVLHPDGYVELKDRSKDIIISGGENISSIGKLGIVRILSFRSSIQFLCFKIIDSIE